MAKTYIYARQNFGFTGELYTGEDNKQRLNFGFTDELYTGEDKQRLLISMQRSP
jgi:hypothetical protein